MFLDRKEAVREIFDFCGKWVAKYDINGTSNNGDADLLHDWGVTQLNSIFPLQNKRVIEMGPQEAPHTIMLHNFGAKRIVALEGRLQNYIKCCVIKNLYELDNCKFYLEDLRKVDLKKFGSFNVCVCSGILYHLPQPQELLAGIAQISPRILINTYYATNDFPRGKKVSRVELNGRKYNGKTSDEGRFKFRDNPGAGLQRRSFWFFKDDLITLLKDLGHTNVQVLREWTGKASPTPPLAAITIYADQCVDKNTK